MACTKEKLLSVTLGVGCLRTHLELKIAGGLTQQRLDNIQSLPSSAFDAKMFRKEFAYLKLSVSMTLLLRRKIISKTGMVVSFVNHDKAIIRLRECIMAT